MDYDRGEVIIVMDKREKTLGVVLGHAVADALGVPVEFEYREDLRKDPVVGMRGYGSHAVPAGTWSDDTSMAIATLDSLSEGIDYDDMMRRFCSWANDNEYSATGELFDIGITTQATLRRYLKGIPALECGADGDYDNGNGSLMRIYPIALYWHFLPDEKRSARDLIDFVFKSSSLTHAHLRSKLGCAIYIFIMLQILEEPSVDAVYRGLEEAREKLGIYGDELQHYARLFRKDFAEIPEDEIKSSGYVVDTLEASIWCLLNSNSYSECVLKAVNLGHDTDTVGAVAGSLAGAMWGAEGIQKDWIDELQNQELIENIIERFVVSLA